MRQLLLNGAHLQHNLKQVRLRAPHSKILAMVKSNAYGHGLVWAAQQLTAAGADGFGVACMTEADTLRAAGITLPIILMSGVQTQEELQQAMQKHYDIVVHHEAQIELLEQCTATASITVWLKIDTGMHRLGFSPDKIKSVWLRVANCAHVNQPIILTTHFSDANEVNQLTTQRQLMLFNLAKATLPDHAQHLSSLANSAGILSWPETHADWVRPGIMLYGASPFAGDNGNNEGLKPVMTVRSQIIALNHLSTGSHVGYGGTFTCERPTLIAVVAFGYGDGYPWQAQHSDVLIRGKRCRVVGRISMDMLQVDVTDLAHVTLGDAVTLWGDTLPAEQVAMNAGTIAYDIFCRLQRHRLAIVEIQ